MDARSRPQRTERSRSDDQHFLRSTSLAGELVRNARIEPHEHVVEIGAGTGRLTAPLAEVARRVTAIEIDPDLAETLRKRFARDPRVELVIGDILDVPLPDEPWRAFGNIPFSLTTPILRRLLDDAASGPGGADLVIQFEAARKRAAVHPSTLLSLGWLPWWHLSLERRVPRLAFEPVPSVDAGVLVVRRREQPLLPIAEREGYVRLLRSAFARGSWPVRRSLGACLPPRTWKRLARERGVGSEARPTDLDVWAWIALFRAVDAD